MRTAVTRDGERPVALLFATSGHSGVDRVVGNLLPELAEAPATFDLLTIRGHGPHLAIMPDNVHTRVLPAAHRNTILPALVWYLRRHRPRALLTASHRLNRAALLARTLARVPCRITIRMGMSLTAQRPELGQGRSRRLFQSMRFWYPRAEAVIAPSEGVGEDLVRHAGVVRERLHVIPNPIVNSHLHRLAAEPVEDSWLANPGIPVVLGAGSLEPRKDFATLLRAFARVREGRACRLVVLGEGRERARLEALARELGIADDLRLPGHVDNPYPYMARAGAFVLSSRREGSGAVLVEAMACGTPVVSTDCPSGPAETLQNGRVGPLVPVGDPDALAAAVDRVLEEPPTSDALRAAAAPFDATASARRYLAAITGTREDGT